MKIVHISGEVTPWSQTGGLAEVLGGLPRAQRSMGDQVLVFTPLYRCVRQRAQGREAGLSALGAPLDVQLGQSSWSVQLVSIDDPDAEGVVFVDVPALFDRGGIYGEDGGDYEDNAVRYAVLASAAVQGAALLCGELDVVHAHDWQAGLAPLYTAGMSPAPVSVFTIHNLAYQGVFDKSVVDAVGLPWSTFTFDQLELYDLVSYLKAGVAFADATTTVSPTYAREITTPENGFGLDGFLQHTARRLTGIVNGIDTKSWDPSTDPALPARYTATDLSGKRQCRQALADELGFELHDDELLCGVVSRFAYQKGLDLIADVAGNFESLRVRLVVLGTGDADLQDRFGQLASDPGNRTTAIIDFDVALARRIYAASDAMLMPSRFEPCGLNQLYAMRYGTIPIAHAVGGLRDTIDDPGDEALAMGQGSGFLFEHADGQGLLWALGRAASMFREGRSGWEALIRAAMRGDWSWSASASRYRALYQELSAAPPVE